MKLKNSKKSIYNSLVNHKKLKRSSFHTPGHKNNANFLKDLLSLDFTELDDTDSLFEANSSILVSEKKASEAFATKRSLISAGGFTLCIQAMLRLVSSPNTKILCSRVVHKSAINTMALLKLEPVFLKQERDIKTGFLKPVNPYSVERYLKKCNNITAVYITSPDYFGVISDIKGISKVCKKYGIPLIVDNAHGSHLKFLSEDLHPLNLGADISSDSLHKTLPVLTGGALLQINNEKYVKKAKSSMALFGSTSPSYPIMASLDLCLDWIAKNAKKEYLDLVKKVSEIKKIVKNKGILMPDGLADPTRISINLNSVGLSGKECIEYFHNLEIEPELYTDDFMVFVVTPFNTDNDILKLKKALLDLEVRRHKILSDDLFQEDIILKMSLNDAILRESIIIKVEDAKGFVSAKTVCQCPPGIPILVPGEVISEYHINFLVRSGILFVEVIK